MSVLSKVSALSSMLSSDNGSYFDPPLESYAAQYFNDPDEIQVKMVMQRKNGTPTQIRDDELTDRNTFESSKSRKAGSVLQQRSGSFDLPVTKKHKESGIVNSSYKN